MIYQCNDCWHMFSTSENKKVNKKTNTFLCQKCSTKYNFIDEKSKKKASETMKNFYKTERGNELKEKFRKNRINYNKNELKNIVLNKSKKEKLQIAKKKRDTFYKHSKEERDEINKKRTTAFKEYNKKRSNIKKEALKNKINLKEYLKRTTQTKEQKDFWNKLRIFVIKKLDFSCQQCDTKKQLSVHHLIPFILYPRHKYLTCLCRSCHMKFERMFENKYIETNSLKKSLIFCLRNLKGDYLYAYKEKKDNS